MEPKDASTFHTIYVVMEYMESDLKKVIRSPIHLELIHIQAIMYRLINSVRHLHEANVIHRDLKPANVLIREDCTIKLCDFGLARQIESDEQQNGVMEDKFGTRSIISPIRVMDERSPQITHSKYFKLGNIRNNNINGERAQLTGILAPN